MTWEGYNYEDAVLISERLVKDDVYTLHPPRGIRIRGPRHPSLARRRSPATSPASARTRCATSTSAASSASARGKCAANDNLVGKVTPKGETELTAEERLLRAIFGGQGPRGARHLPARAARRVRHRRGCEDIHPREPRRTFPRRQPRWCASTSPRSAKISVWRQDGRPPRQQGRGQAAYCPRRTCPSCRTARRWTSCSIRWAFPAA